MKTDLATTIITAIAGIVIAYFATTILIPDLTDVSFKTLGESVNTTLSEPDVEIFNFRAINPTVEVYVGQCTKYNSKGECIDNTYQSSDDDTDTTDGDTAIEDDESPNEEENGNTN